MPYGKSRTYHAGVGIATKGMCKVQPSYLHEVRWPVLDSGFSGPGSSLFCVLGQEASYL